ncbi:MAG: hypothetical protein CMJ83_05700 [Planctomycetes bacterium]|nr:hypothetical protein [Planctomycetota bacterium]
MTIDPRAPISCEDARALSVDLLYGELDRAEQPRLERHLESCAECRDQQAGHQDVRKLLDRWRPDPRIDEVSRNSRRTWWRVASVAAALFVGACLLGTRVSWQDGSVTFSFAATAAVEEQTDLAASFHRLIEAAHRESNDRLRSLHEQILIELEQSERENDAAGAALVRALERRLVRERREIGAMIGRLARAAMDESALTRNAFHRMGAPIAREARGDKR